MNVEPRIAVVIPCYDDGRTVGGAVESVRRQEPCEIVVVDDGSRDEATREVLAALAATGVGVVRQPNQGVAAARTAGVEATTAPYVFNLDADDELEPAALTALADELDAHPEVDVVWGGFRYLGERSHEKRVATELDPWLQTYINDMPVSALFRREALVAAGGWQGRAAYEDWDLWLALAEHGARGRGLPFPAFRYRVHGERMYRASRPRHNELYDALRARHEALFRQRPQNRRRSRAPALVKLAFPAIDALWPGMSYRKASLLAAVWHVANGRGGLRRPLVRFLRRLPQRRTPPEEGVVNG